MRLADGSPAALLRELRRAAQRRLQSGVALLRGLQPPAPPARSAQRHPRHAGNSSGTKTAAVFFFALLPIAVAVGVIVEAQRVQQRQRSASRGAERGQRGAAVSGG